MIWSCGDEWMIKNFDEVFEDVTKLGTKIKTDEYHPTGKYQIIDQGQEAVAGYTDLEDGVFENVPAIIFGDHTRIVKYVDQPLFLGADGVKVLRSRFKDANYRYLYYALKSVKIPNTGYNRHFKWLKEAKIKYPSSEEQSKIVLTLNGISSVIEHRQQQLQKLDELVKARFIEMFGNFVYERDRWSICEIGDVADTIDPQPSHRTPPVSLDGIPYIGIAECNYKTFQIDFANARKVGRDVLQEHLNRYTLDKGDFIIGKIGTIGKPFVLPVKQTYTLSANTVLIKPNKLRVEPQFLFAVFQSEYMERIIDAEKKSTSQPAFGIQKVRKIDIPMPPLELQQQFAAFVEQANKSKVTVQKALDEAQLLFDSLMQKYFG